MNYILLLLVSSFALAQDVPFFTSDFPPEEFAARRAKVYESIGPAAIAVVQGAESPQGYTRFRQSNEFYYLCGIEVPHAYLVLNGAAKTATVFLPHRNAGRERSEGKVLSAEDADEVKKLSGIESVMGVDLLPEILGRYERGGTVSDLYAPFAPAEGFAMSRDLALRYENELAADPLDGRLSREQTFLKQLRERFPTLTVKNLTPALDDLRSVKSPREIALIRKATRLGGLALIEGMRSTKPGIFEHELDGMAKYVYYRNGAQGEAYYSLIASGPNAMIGHYNGGKRKMQSGEWLLFDFAPDVGYYMSDVTRMIPVDGKFSLTQRELYGFYLACYKAILNAIKPNATGQAMLTEAVKEMESVFAKTKFSKELYTKACSTYVDRFKRQAQNPKATLGHWTGMATHDVGSYGGPYKPGMVFTIEPALVIPEENVNIRLEDLIVITETGKDVVSDFIPMDPDAIEKVMKEEGMLQRYPRDGGK